MRFLAIFSIILVNLVFLEAQNEAQQPINQGDGAGEIGQAAGHGDPQLPKQPAPKQPAPKQPAPKQPAPKQPAPKQPEFKQPIPKQPEFPGKIIQAPTNKLPQFHKPIPNPPKHSPPPKKGGSWHWHPRHGHIWFPINIAPRTIVLPLTYQLPPQVHYYQSGSYVICPNCGQLILVE